MHLFVLFLRTFVIFFMISFRSPFRRDYVFKILLFFFIKLRISFFFFFIGSLFFSKELLIFLVVFFFVCFINLNFFFCFIYIFLRKSWTYGVLFFFLYGVVDSLYKLRFCINRFLFWVEKPLFVIFWTTLLHRLLLFMLLKFLQNEIYIFLSRLSEFLLLSIVTLLSFLALFLISPSS